VAQIYLSFDLWTSPNNFSILGIVCHFINAEFKACTLLLGMKRLFRPHSGENLAQLVIKSVQTYNLANRLGFCVMDNAGDNNTALVTIQNYLYNLPQSVNWSGSYHRLRCFGHVVSLVANAFTANKPLNTAKVRVPKGLRKAVKVK
jgi:hypothetical protein